MILLVIFGLILLFPRLSAAFAALTRRLRPGAGAARAVAGGKLGGFALGATLGLVWTPCAGPILASILTVVATAPRFGDGASLLLAYAVGAAVPMLAIAYGGQAVTTRARSFAQISGRLQQGFGALIVCFAIAMHFQYDTLITAWLTEFYPGGQIGL